MKITRRPMLTTILYGLLCGISFVPTVMVLSSFFLLVHRFQVSDLAGSCWLSDYPGQVGKGEFALYCLSTSPASSPGVLGR